MLIKFERFNMFDGASPIHRRTGRPAEFKLSFLLVNSIYNISYCCMRLLPSKMRVQLAHKINSYFELLLSRMRHSESRFEYENAPFDEMLLQISTKLLKEGSFTENLQLSTRSLYIHF